MDKYNLGLYQSIGNSNTSQLARIHKFCNTEKNTSLESVLMCMYKNILIPYVLYFNTNNINAPNGVYVWQGIAKFGNRLLIVGTSQPSATKGQGVIYFGDINCNGGITYTLSVPGAQYSSVYGPRYDFNTGLFTFVGSYNLPNDTNTYAFLFRGTLDQLNTIGNYTLQMHYSSPNNIISFSHSTDGDFVVGNSGSLNPVITSWVYNINTSIYTPIKFPGSVFTTTYGIVKNSNNSYTIVGGYSSTISLSITQIYTNKGVILNPTISAFIADFTYIGGSITFSNWTSIKYLNSFTTHFEGINLTNNPDIYTIAADIIDINRNIGYFLRIQRINNSFVPLHWVPINYNGNPGITSSNSVIDNNIVGIFAGSDGSTQAFQSTVIL